MSCRLLVEGPDDFNVIRNFLRERREDLSGVDVHPCGGYSSLLLLIEEHLTIGSYDSIGIVVVVGVDNDADRVVAADGQMFLDEKKQQIGRAHV